VEDKHAISWYGFPRLTTTNHNRAEILPFC
jgi:hypothetical protein